MRKRTCPSEGRETGAISPGGWAHDATGRVVTCPDPAASLPEAYVLADGVLVRAALDRSAGCLPGAEVTLRFDEAAGRLYAVIARDGDTGAH